MTLDELRVFSRNPNVAAFLSAVRAAEGTADEKGWQTTFGYKYFDDFSDHPRRKVSANGYTSTAAGAFQFLESTWDEVRTKYGLSDFSPANQTLAAIDRLAYRKALEPILAGDLDLAVERANNEWASLPGAPYGQPTRSMEFVRKAYAAAGGALGRNGPAPVEQRTFPQEQEKMALSPLIPIALDMLVNVVPTLAELFKGEKPSKVAERNLDAFEILVQKLSPLILEAAKAQSIPAAAEVARANPPVAQAIDSSVKVNYVELQKAAEASIGKAREFAIAYSQVQNVRTINKGLTFHEFLSLIFAIFGMWGAGYVLVNNSAFGDQIVGGVITLVVVGGFIAVKEFWLGTSSESQRKTDLLVEKGK